MNHNKVSHIAAPCDPLTIFSNHSPPELLSTYAIIFLKSYNIQISPIIHLAPTFNRHQICPLQINYPLPFCHPPPLINNRPPSKCRKLRYALQIPLDSCHTSFWCTLYLHDSVCAPSMLMVFFNTYMTH